MFESRRDKALALLAVLGLGAWAFRYLRRLNDPLDYLSLSVAYEPQLSIARFEGLRQYDALTYDDAMAAMREFSRQYQASFLAETDPAEVVRGMARARSKMHANFHTLRQWLPNDLPRERRVLAGIEETDARMALAMRDVAKRYPSVALLHGAGILADPSVKAAHDLWT